MSKLELTQEELDDKIKQAVEDATAGLVKKNQDLLAEKKKLQKGQEIDPAELERLESALETAKAELTRVTKEHKAALKLAETATKQLESEQKAVHTLYVENGLNDALTKAGVTDPFYLKAAKAILAGNIKLEQDGENRVVKMGDKPLADAIKEWAGSDEGKRFAAAQQNSGGGAAGGSGKGGAAPTMTRTAFDALDPSAKAAAVKGGTTLTD